MQAGTQLELRDFINCRTSLNFHTAKVSMQIKKKKSKGKCENKLEQCLLNDKIITLDMITKLLENNMLMGVCCSKWAKMYCPISPNLKDLNL